jgi:large repetitive protein
VLAYGDTALRLLRELPCAVAHEKMRVTAGDSAGFFLQLPPSETLRHRGPDHSGVYVYTGSKPKVVSGDARSITSAVVKDC